MDTKFSSEIRKGTNSCEDIDVAEKYRLYENDLLTPNFYTLLAIYICEFMFCPRVSVHLSAPSWRLVETNVKRPGSVSTSPP